MAEETVNQGAAQAPETAPAGEQAAAEAERTFKQSEVDAIIGDRLQRERAKYADYNDLKTKAAQSDDYAAKLEAEKERGTELQNRLDALQKDIDARNARDKVSAETGVPASFLSGRTEEECRIQADAIIKWREAQPNYPTVRDGGTVNQFTGGATRDQFASWAKANLNL